MKTPTLFLAALLFSPLALTQAHAHCQVPCGIYDDKNVLDALHTDYVTIEKATAQIVALSKDANANANQLSRWITNKEAHAQKIQDTVSQYFLAQRLKVPAKDASEADKKAYMAKLALCHQVIVYAMKCKQGTDAKNVNDLHNSLHHFVTAFAPKK